jgi:hypothetical protein
MNATQQKVALQDVKTDAISGRAAQLTASNVSYLTGVLDCGLSFTTRPTVTKDLVLVDGHNRVEAYRQFFALTNLPAEQQVFDADVLPIVWENASDAQKQTLNDFALKANWHTKGQAATARDLRLRVGGLLEDGYTEKEVIARLQPEVPAAQTRQAITDHKKVQTQAAVKHAQDLVATGMKVAKAKAVANLPADYPLPEKGEKVRDRLHKLRTAAQQMSNKWSAFANPRLAEYRETGRGQEALTSVGVSMMASAAILLRKAKAVQEQIAAAVEERAKRERR